MRTQCAVETGNPFRAASYLTVAWHVTQTHNIFQLFFHKLLFPSFSEMLRKWIFTKHWTRMSFVVCEFAEKEWTTAVILPTYPTQSVIHSLCFINMWRIWKYIVHISCLFSIQGMLKISYRFVNMAFKNKISSYENSKKVHSSGQAVTTFPVPYSAVFVFTPVSCIICTPSISDPKMSDVVHSNCPCSGMPVYLEGRRREEESRLSREPTTSQQRPQVLLGCVH
jgi:hypothetical protein